MCKLVCTCEREIKCRLVPVWWVAKFDRFEHKVQHEITQISPNISYRPNYIPLFQVVQLYLNRFFTSCNTRVMNNTEQDVYAH